MFYQIFCCRNTAWTLAFSPPVSPHYPPLLLPSPPPTLLSLHTACTLPSGSSPLPTDLQQHPLYPILTTQAHTKSHYTCLCVLCVSLNWFDQLWTVSILSSCTLCSHPSATGGGEFKKNLKATKKRSLGLKTKCVGSREAGREGGEGWGD